jgi:hypothetical protein
VAFLVVAIVVALTLHCCPRCSCTGTTTTGSPSSPTGWRRYRRSRAQAPELRRALDAMRERDGRRFYLKNTAPNLAGAELQELVRAAIESNGGRITTSQNQVPRDEGRFRQISVSVQFFASTPALQKILYAIEAGPPYVLVENMTLRPLNAFRGYKPLPGQEPEVNVQIDAAGYAFADPSRK